MDPSTSLGSSSVPTLLLAALGTGVGSVVRDACVHEARVRLGRADLGILAANLAATAVAATAGVAGDAGMVLLGVGFAGGLSTWSALAVEVAGFLRERRRGRVLLHLPIAFLLALLLANALGRVVGAGGAG